MITQDTIDRVRQQTDIAELVGGYLSLKRSGRSMRGLCPFHPDRSPSFYVSPERQTYHCFGCGAGGNAISFVMEIEKLEFPEAIRFLARRLGIEVVEKAGTPERHREVYDACEQAAGCFQRQLGRSEEARRYLKQRGIGDDTSRRFRIGFAAGGNALRGEAKRRGWNEVALRQAGLLVERGSGLGDYFQERLVFPIMSLSGRVIGFGGRVLGNREPKYLNSPDTDIFRKGDNLYGGFQAKGYIRDQVPLLVEGNFDLLSLVEQGINNVVAPLGTALTASQATLIRRYNPRVRVCFDGDTSGRKAGRRALDVLLAAGCEPQFVVLPEGEDPDSYVRRKGRQAFVQLASAPADLVDYVVADRRAETVPDKRALLRELVGILRLIPDEATQELYANRVASAFDLEKRTVMRAVRPVTSGSRSGRPAPTQSRSSGIAAKLAAAVVQEAGLAGIAREYRLSEVLDNERLSAIVRLCEEHCTDPGFGPSQVLDLIEDTDTKRMVAGWTITETELPDEAEFRSRLRRLRAAWLQAKIVAAHEQGMEQEAERLIRERGNLLRPVTEERSNLR